MSYLPGIALSLYLPLIDRIIIAIGFILFSCAVLYVVSKRIGLLKLQRKVTAALKAGMAGKAETGLRGNQEGINIPHIVDNVIPNLNLPLDRPMHDEL